MNPIISIIVPIYNVEKYLNQAIDSLLNQVDYNYEIILVNDGSKDRSGEICEQYKSQFPKKIMVLHKENGGLPSARKAGVKIAKGKYISFLDGDDWCSPEYYYNMVNEAENHQLEVVCSVFTYANGEQLTDYKGKIKDGIYSGKNLRELKKHILYMPPYYSYGIMPSIWSKVIKKELIERYIYSIPNEVTLGEDALCSYPVLFQANRIGILNSNKGYYYRFNPISMSNSYDSKKIIKIINAGNYLKSVMKPLYDVYKDQIDIYITQLIKDAIKNESLADSIGELQIKNLEELRKEEWVISSLSNLYDIPIKYKLYFFLFRKNKMKILLIFMKLFNRIRKR